MACESLFSAIMRHTAVHNATRGRTLTTLAGPLYRHSKPAEVQDGIQSEIDPEDLIEQKRNKSGLREHHYRRFHKLPKELTEDEEQVFPLKFQRKLYGQFGAISNIDPAKAWPSKEELKLAKEWESVAYPHTVHEMIAEAKKEKQIEEEKIAKRQNDIAQKVAKLEDWKREVRQRLAKQKRDAYEAKEKKERLMEEVRQIFGFRIDPKDDRFKEALLQKEREEKRASKEAKKIEKQQKMMESLRKMAQENASTQKDTAATGLHGSSIMDNTQLPPKQ